MCLILNPTRFIYRLAPNMTAVFYFFLILWFGLLGQTIKLKMRRAKKKSGSDLHYLRLVLVLRLFLNKSYLSLFNQEVV